MRCFALGKDALLAGNIDKAISYLSGVNGGSNFGRLRSTFALPLYAIRGEVNRAIEDFSGCVSNRHKLERGLDSESRRLWRGGERG